MDGIDIPNSAQNNNLTNVPCCVMLPPFVESNVYFKTPDSKSQILIDLSPLPVAKSLVPIGA
jgi:hypothetical protein